MSRNKCDPRALKVARELHRSEQPELTILFGSRARGDYREYVSDIDIMLVQAERPSMEQQCRVERAALDAAERFCGRPVPVQVVWKTSQEFDRMRRTLNDVVVHALREGVIMPPEQENRRQSDGDDHSYEWMVTDERIRKAEMHLDAFNILADMGLSDLIAGQSAHPAMAHALKALISAHRQRFAPIYDIAQLIRDAAAVDPDFQFRPGIDAGLYNQYADRHEYRPVANPISHIPGYRETVNGDVTALLNRVREIRGGNRD